MALLDELAHLPEAEAEAALQLEKVPLSTVR